MDSNSTTWFHSKHWLDLNDEQYDLELKKWNNTVKENGVAIIRNFKNGDKTITFANAIRWDEIKTESITKGWKQNYGTEDSWFCPFCKGTYLMSIIAPDRKWAAFMDTGGILCKCHCLKMRREENSAIESNRHYKPRRDLYD